jgi:hypothetical protein
MRVYDRCTPRQPTVVGIVSNQNKRQGNAGVAAGAASTAPPVARPSECSWAPVTVRRYGRDEPGSLFWHAPREYHAGPASRTLKRRQISAISA